MSAQPKPKRCRVCRRSFMPRSSFAVACSPTCALVYGKRRAEIREKRKAQQERAERRVKREAIKSRRELAREAQRHCNAWIRWRDRGLPCISCGRFHEGQWHAGHYRTTAAAPELRFEPLNIHKQCAPCNNHKSGNIIEYRLNLIARIGLDKVEWLEGPHPPKKYTAEELRAIRDYYRQKLREEKRNAAV